MESNDQKDQGEPKRDISRGKEMRGGKILDEFQWRKLDLSWTTPGRK